MDAKEYLEQAFTLNELIGSEQRELEELKNQIEKVTGVNYEQVRSMDQKYSTNATFVKLIFKKIERAEAIESEIAKLENIKKEIAQKINLLSNPKERLVLRYQYVELLDKYQIEKTMKYCLRTIERIRRSALKNFQKILESEGIA